MSRRTTPLSVSTSGPFEPSTGYGPAVPSGIAVVIVEAAPDVVVDGAPVPAPAPFFEPHAATIAATPAPPSTWRARRRRGSSAGRTRARGRGHALRRRSGR